MKLVVGLGNPGREYEETRHNAGFLVVDYLAREEGLTFGSSDFRADLARGRVAGQEVLLAKPQTYMNLSGLAVGPLVRWYKLDPTADLLVVSDDLDLPLGRLRLRARGSHGGHRGLLSIINELGTTDFARLRLGIGRPGEHETAKDKVLGTFTEEEGRILDEVILAAVGAIRTWLAEGTEAAMNRYNGFKAPSAADEGGGAR
ncbi:MAG: peptidyl-tRNA hydrolase, family [Bacillota bacterium]|jgi:PTH1 family peptidyl-tRNA hydrolase|nr:peptidyl-tRNA hydrolase, family [Bacillota bacterium]MDK2855371.1 peptidyl-tRNA hydrolase, family [Bacillota bacterium]MDK2924495.1 peptidyl-tRNA hydrolase, family [Bacillota bacterium]